jgi:ubiquinone/menaquinone biosynthesis C-methylase UbiE
MTNNYVNNKNEVRMVSKVRNNYFRKFVDFIIKQSCLKMDSVVVDTPCGTGEMTQLLLKKGVGKKYYLLDINPFMTKEARNRLPKKSTIITGDANNIANFIPERVDTIFCLNGFHIYLSRKRQFLKGCYKILRPGGTLIFDVSTKGLNNEQSKRFLVKENAEMRILSRNKFIKYCALKLANHNTLKNYQNLLREAGFSIKTVKMFDTWKSVDELVDETTKIPGRLRSRLLNTTDKQRVTIYKEANEVAKQETGIKRIEHNRIFFVAKKP